MAFEEQTINFGFIKDGLLAGRVRIILGKNYDNLPIDSMRWGRVSNLDVDIVRIIDKKYCNNSVCPNIVFHKNLFIGKTMSLPNPYLVKVEDDTTIIFDELCAVVVFSNNTGILTRRYVSGQGCEEQR